MSYRPPTTSKYAPADPAPGQKSYKPRVWAKEEPKEKIPTAADFPALKPQDFPNLKPVAKSDSSASLASNTSNTSKSSETMADRMRKKLEEEEAERQRKEEEERMKREKKEKDMSRDREARLMYSNIITFSDVSRRVAEEREMNESFAHPYEYNEEDRYDRYNEEDNGYGEYENNEYGDDNYGDDGDYE